MTPDVGSHHPQGTTLAELVDGRRLCGFADEHFGKVVDASGGLDTRSAALLAWSR